ncbi:DUF1843 domain-containing protein [Nevskia sp.]|uniref:DUF1843 domain-containing protein n=1 Tax=Nevskia sp. TaxID=1929292 RepID=UPI0025EAE3C4|nr:DUF1843 domain-containing protein [Nevskia sp.]
MARPIAYYGIPIQAAITKGDLEEMKTLAAAVDKHLADQAEVASALKSLKAEIKKREKPKK